MGSSPVLEFEVVGLVVLRLVQLLHNDFFLEHGNVSLHLLQLHYLLGLVDLLHPLVVVRELDFVGRHLVIRVLLLNIGHWRGLVPRVHPWNRALLVLLLHGHLVHHNRVWLDPAKDALGGGVLTPIELRVLLHQLVQVD